MTSNNPQTREWQALSSEHHLAPFSDFKQLKEKGPRIITNAKGVYLWDSEGNKILDGMAGLWCVAIGYGRDELADAAAKQMRELPYYNLFFQTAHPPALELAKAIADVAPQGMNHVFFTGSGSEGNDTMLRMVRHYWAIKGQPNKKVIISRKNGYHGSTVAGASLGGMTYMHEQGDLPIPGIVHIAQPYWFAEGGDMSPEEFGIWAANQLEEKILEVGVDNVGAFIAEPIQGAGGVIIPPETYWPRIKEILAKYDILFVADEVICGFGRTGNMFGSQTFNMKPDIMTLSKQISSSYLPISAFMFNDRVYQPVADESARLGVFGHGYTGSGHPVAAAVAVENLKIIEERDLVTNARETGAYMQKRLRELADHPLVGEVRGVGLIAALELVGDKATKAPHEKVGTLGGLANAAMFGNGVITRNMADAIAFCPPMIITPAQVDDVVAATKKSLDETLTAIGRS